MSIEWGGELGVPSRPIVIRQETYGPAAARPRHPARSRPPFRTWRRIMYLVGLATQAAVLGAIVAVAISYEAPIRARLGLTAPADTAVTASIADVDARIEALTATVERLTGTLEPVLASTAAPDAPDPDAVEQRLAELERSVARLGATTHPASTPETAKPTASIATREAPAATAVD